VAQADWPKSTLVNPQGSPLLAAAACVRGFVDMVFYLIERGLPWTADMLETLDQLLVAKLGPRWWVRTEIERFAPNKKEVGWLSSGRSPLHSSLPRSLQSTVTNSTLGLPVLIAVSRYYFRSARQIASIAQEPNKEL
jgi:hypothetical protein